MIGERVVIAMVGLPARGKSCTSKAIVHFSTFLGCPVRLFNAGNKRRTKGLAGASATFFDASNTEAQKQREQLRIEHSLADWVLFLDDDTMPEPDLLFEYWVAMERQLGPSAPHDGLPAFGFAGVTSFVEREDSQWAVVARCSN